MKSLKSVIVVISIDTECDKNAKWEVQHPLKFSSVLQGIPLRLSPLFEEFGIVPTYLLSPEVIQDPQCVDVLQKLPNTELGAHLHAEFLINKEGSNVNRTSTPQFLYEPDVEFDLLQKLTSLFKSVFGYDPKSFRAGRFGISKHTIGFLEEMGYLVDSSVTPFRKIDFGNCNIVNFWGAPYYPYHPSYKDFARKGNSKVLEVPVSTIIPSIANYRLPVLTRFGEYPNVYKKVIRGLSKLNLASSKLVWIRPFRDTPEGLLNGIEQIIRLWKASYPPIINIMFHSVEVVAKASPYAQTEKDVQYLMTSLRKIFVYLSQNYNLISMNISELINL